MTLRTPVYLDYHATTPVDPRVWERMAPYFCTCFGNPASQNHAYGRDAAAATERARREVAALVGAAPDEIVFTAGATESNNLALKGAVAVAPAHRRHVVMTAIEHRSVLEPGACLARQGVALTVLPVPRDGRLEIAALAAALRPETLLVSVIAAHNEIGVVQDMAALGRLLRPRGILFHTDATQAAGKIPVDVGAWQVDLLSLSSHKMYGPKGAGALYVRTGTPLGPLLDGGGQERGLRGGTLNVPGIVGLGAAAALAQEEMPAEAARLAALRDRLREAICTALPDTRVNGSHEHRLPHNLHLTFPGLDGEALLLSLDDVAVSAGSACTSLGHGSSHVLAALGLSADEAHSSLRFGLGRWTSAEEIDYAAARIVEAVTQLRALA